MKILLVDMSHAYIIQPNCSSTSDFVSIHMQQLDLPFQSSIEP